MKILKTLFATEAKLSLRGMDMLIFAIIIPIIVTIIIGLIYRGAPAYPGASFTFIEQSFGAIAAISICAGGVMGLPLIIADYRQKKILKRFKVTPISPIVIIFTQLLIYFAYSIVSLLLTYAVITKMFSGSFSGSILGFMLSYMLVLVAMFSIGVMVGGIASDSKTAGIISSLLYFPMLIFSGATLPYEIMPQSMQRVVNVLPLTQGIKLLKASSLGTGVDNVIESLISLVLLSLLCYTIAIKYFRWE